jgi:hypothetical protein
MSVPLTLLGLLEREPSHGYDLKRDYDTWFGRGKPLPYGQARGRTLLPCCRRWSLPSSRRARTR